MIHSEGFLALVTDAKSRVKEETPEQALKRLDENEGARLVDVREDDEWREGHVDGAVHLGKGVIERDIERTFPDRNIELHLYCGGGFRSALVADNLQKMGYNNVFSIDGGYKAFKDMGVRIISGDR